MFKALILNKKKMIKNTGTIENINLSDLPQGDVLINVKYSTLNYKDSLQLQLHLL